MILYRITFINDDDIATNQWEPTQDRARAEARRLKLAGFTGVTWEQVNVPTDKASLLAFLNSESNTPALETTE